MASKADRMYFQNLAGAAEYCCKAADHLVECMTAYDPSKIDEMLLKMHEIEHSADLKKHEMTEALAHAFVTPFDREDLAALSQNIDDVADKLEEVMQRFYVDEITEITEDCVRFSKLLVQCCCLMRDVVADLENFKKSGRLRAAAIRVGDAEEECDKLYLEVSRKVRTQFSDPMDIIAWRTIYDCMEECADACSHVADMVETVVMKNT